MFLKKILLNNIFLVWFGVIFLHEGFYAEAVFRFNIIIPDTFPDSGTPVSINL